MPYVNYRHLLSSSAVRQSGVTLIELLIAMVLGLVLMGGAIQVLLSNSRTAAVVDAQVDMQTNARFAFFLLAEDVQMAGYKSTILPREWGADIELLTSLWRDQEYPEGGVAGEFELQAIVYGEDAFSGPTGDSDLLHIRLQGEPDDSVLDCAGGVIPELVWVQQSYSINAEGELTCTVDGGDSALLASGVEEFQLTYGINEDPQQPYQVSQFVTASNVPAGSWNDVVVVKVGLLAASSNESLSSDAVGPFQILDFTTGTYEDGRVRAPFEKTIRLRNRQLDALL